MIVLSFRCSVSFSLSPLKGCIRNNCRYRLYSTSESPSTTASSYEFIDSGNKQRLERFGGVIVSRPCPSATWKRDARVTEWNSANLIFTKPKETAADGLDSRHAMESSGWSWNHLPPSFASVHEKDRKWEVFFEATNQKFVLAPSSEGQLGIFPEQEHNWSWIFQITKKEILWRQGVQSSNAQNVTISGHQDQMKKPAPTPTGPLRVLNGFAYTGGSTLAAASGGRAASTAIASIRSSNIESVPPRSPPPSSLNEHTESLSSPFIEVVHLDAAKSAVTWAQQNALASEDLLSTRSIRWIEDDCISFLEREIKRGKTYDALIFDPPAFGRAARGKKMWKLDKDFETLVNMIPKLLSDNPAFLLLSCHDIDWPHSRLSSLLSSVTSKIKVAGTLESGVMSLNPKVPQRGNPLPMGAYARWSRNRKR